MRTLRLALIGLFCLITCASAHGATRPNIIVLVADDQRWDTLGCAGNPLIRTPNIDRLASRGVRFPNAFVTTSICMTSRASIFSGLHQRSHGVDNFQKTLAPAVMDASYPMALRKAGYRTGFVGKWGLGNPMPVERFDYWKGFPGQGRYVNPGRKYLTAEQGDHAVEFLRGCSKDQPFCLSLSFKAPHVQDGNVGRYPVDPEIAPTYKDVTFPTPPNFKSAGSVPSLVEKTLNRTREGPDFTEETYQATMRAIATMITGIDHVVGQITSELETLGLADNTVILYTSDNGFLLGEHGGLGGKWLMYEESIRVPMILYDSRHKQNTVRPEMVLNIDIAPTIYELAGLTPPTWMQGRSLLSLTGDKKAGDWRTEWFYEHTFGPDMLAPVEGVRTTRWKYVRYIGVSPVVEQLFDLKDDPREEEDLSNDPQHRQTLDHLRSRWSAWMGALEKSPPDAPTLWREPS